MKMNHLNELKIIMIPISKIRPNPYQPRKVFDQVMLEELSNSIKEFGVIQPINVRIIKNDIYELVAGERRLRAAKLAKLEQIPAIVIDVNDKDSAVLALIENLQRENLNYIEEAEGYSNLIEDYSLTQEEIAKQVGKTQSTIANKLRLLKLSDSVIKMLVEHNLSERHARALLRLPNKELQLHILDKIIIQSLNVKKTEDLIETTLAKILSEDQKHNRQNPNIKRYLNDVRIFTNTIKQAVEMMKNGGVEINYRLEEGNDNYHITIDIPMNKK